MRNQKGLAPARGAVEATLLSAGLMQALRLRVTSVTQVESVSGGKWEPQ